MTYNLTALKAAGNLVDLVSYTNSVTNMLFSAFIVIAFFFIMLFSLKRYDFAQAFISSSFVMFLVSLLLSTAGLLNIIFPLFFITATALGALYLYTSGY